MNLIVQLKSAFRQGKYSESLWKELTNQTAQELDTAWRADLEKSFRAQPQSRY